MTVIDGGDGEDILTGGTGNDIYVVNDGDDQVIELAGGGIDEIGAANITIDVPRRTRRSRTWHCSARLGNGPDGNALANKLDRWQRQRRDGIDTLLAAPATTRWTAAAAPDQLDGGAARRLTDNIGGDTLKRRRRQGQLTVLATTSNIIELANGRHR